MREGWEIRTLGDILIFDKRFNGLPKGQQDRIAHFTHVSAEELKSLKVDDGDVKLISTGQFDGYTTKDLAGCNLNRGEIITIPTGGTANIKYYSGFFVDSGNLIGIARDASICLKYVYFGMTCKKDEINSYYRGVSIKHPFMPDICKITIPIPSVQEQEKIVAELDCLTDIIAKKQQQLEELDKLAQSVFYDMFGDPIANEKGWEVKQVREVAMVKIGPFGSLLHAADYITGGCPVINPVHMRNGHIFAEADFTVGEEKRKEMGPYFLECNDLVFGRRGDIGRCALVSATEAGYICGTGSLIVRFTAPIVPIFALSYFLSSEAKQLLVSQAKGATMLNINCGIVENLPVILPPLALQNEFAKKIEAIEKQKELVKRSIAETETLFNSRMDFWFN